MGTSTERKCCGRLSRLSKLLCIRRRMDVFDLTWQPENSLGCYPPLKTNRNLLHLAKSPTFPSPHSLFPPLLLRMSRTGTTSAPNHSHSDTQGTTRRRSKKAETLPAGPMPVVPPPDFSNLKQWGPGELAAYLSRTLQHGPGVVGSHGSLPIGEIAACFQEREKMGKGFLRLDEGMLKV